MKRLREQVERMTGGEWEVEFDHNDQANIYAHGRPTEWIALLPHQCVVSIEDEQKRNAAGICALRNAAPALLALVDAVSALVAWQELESRSAAELDNRLDVITAAYRALLDQIP